MESTRKFITLSFLVLLAFPCFGQDKDEKYPSRAEKAYQATQRNKKLEPASLSFIKSLTHDHIILKSRETNNKFVNIYEATNYARYFDSLTHICYTRLWKVIGAPEERHLDWPVPKFLRYYDSLEKLGIPRSDKTPQNINAEKECSRCVDSVKRIARHRPIAGIDFDLVMRHDSLGNKNVVVYYDYKLMGFLPGLWVAISDDVGKTWGRYFTGLVLNHFYYIKPNPKIKLFKNDSTIEVEITIVRDREDLRYAVSEVDPYELIEDNVVMEINLAKIEVDSDHDGLTDILERRLFTNPFSKDTDGDGVDDRLDSNPRFKSVETKYSNLFLSLLESFEHDSTFVPFDNFEPKKSSRRDTSTYFIITDDPRLMGLGKTSMRYIILTTSEFDDYKRQNPGPFRELTVSPLFEVDNRPGVFKVHIGGSFWGNEYLIIEKKKGWVIKTILQWIS